MNKADLINNISSDAKVTKVQAQAALNSFLASTSTALKKATKLSL